MNEAGAVGKSLLVSVGRGDGFYAADTALANVLRAPGQPVRYLAGEGDHSFRTFWKQAGAAFPFYANALARCR